MYSPKIPDRLIPVLYRLARARRQPMTTLVAEILDAYLNGIDSPHRATATPATSESRLAPRGRGRAPRAA